MSLTPAAAWNESYSNSKHPTMVRLEMISTYLAVFLAPFATFRFFGLNFTISDLFYCASFGVLILAGLIPRSPLQSAMWYWMFGSALLLLGLLGASLINGDAARGLLVCVQYLFAYVLLVPLVIRGDIDRMQKLAMLFLAGVIVIDIHGILSFYLVGYVPTLPGEGKGIVTGARRLATILGNPNLAGAINALVIPSLLYLWFAGRLPRWFASTLLAIIVVTVVLTSSNSGLAAMTLSLLIFIGLVANVRLLVRLSILALILAVILYVGGLDLLPSAFQKRVLGALTTGDIDEAGSFVSRTQLMLEALSVISAKQILLLGIGADQFRTISVQNAPVHNIYLLLWVEGGLVALFGWLFYAGVGITLAYSAWRLRLERHVAASTLATCGVFLLIAFSNPHMYGRYWTTPVLISIGIVAVHLRAWAIEQRKKETYVTIKDIRSGAAARHRAR